MKTHSFRKFLLDHEDFVSGMSLVSFCNDFDQPLQHTEKLNFLRKNIHRPFMRFLYRKCLFKDPFYWSTDFQNFCCTFCDKQDAAKKIFHLHLNGCKKKTLLDTRKRTLR